MTAGPCHKFATPHILFITAITLILFLSGYQNQIEKATFGGLNDEIPQTPSGGSEGDCIDIKGSVLGDIIPGTKVLLYKTESHEFKDVMTHIRTQNPVMSETVAASKIFVFRCLNPGNYAFVIPTFFFNASIGSPLPYEFDCRNFSSRIAFQGGDRQYAVGAFSINHTAGNQQNCSENLFPCIRNEGILYRECSFILSQ